MYSCLIPSLQQKINGRNFRIPYYLSERFKERRTTQCPGFVFKRDANKWPGNLSCQSLNYLVLTACQAPVVKNMDNTVDKSLKDEATQLTFLLPKVGTH